MSEKRYLSSLKRGLSALTALNQVGRLRVTDLAKRIKVPRTTAYRILETLAAEGFVQYEKSSHHYCLSDPVRSLANGFNRDQVLTTVGRPILRGLCQELLTPVGMTTPLGQEMVLQIATDNEAPLALTRFPEGSRFPVLYGASGKVFLAYCGDELRNRLINLSLEQPSTSARQFLAGAVPTDADLEYVRRQEYAVVATREPICLEGVLAVPVFHRKRYAASITMRFMKRQMSPMTAVERYLPKLRSAARDIEAHLERAGEVDLPPMFGLIETSADQRRPRAATRSGPEAA